MAPATPEPCGTARCVRPGWPSVRAAAARLRAPQCRANARGGGGRGERRARCAPRAPLHSPRQCARHGVGVSLREYRGSDAGHAQRAGRPPTHACDRAGHRSLCARRDRHWKASGPHRRRAPRCCPHQVQGVVVSVDAEARAPRASNRPLGWGSLWGYTRSWGGTPEVVMGACPIRGRDGGHPMDAFGSHE